MAAEGLEEAEGEKPVSSSVCSYIAFKVVRAEELSSSVTLDVFEVGNSVYVTCGALPLLEFLSLFAVSVLCSSFLFS